ncbi:MULTISPECIES: hypothetical protein [unclassified Variovorax]|uniref:hypothetical protein n=1 Tax=unclassified Variovorax TaxID=663243 RepID=UPI00076C03E9|nr:MULTISPECIES: hypothetical protein [unclassified Variovorax]KWT69592.1 hypothetical protein APY03_6952 [Variovorax sp. WDL1]
MISRAICSPLACIAFVSATMQSTFLRTSNEIAMLSEKAMATRTPGNGVRKRPLANFGGGARKS